VRLKLPQPSGQCHLVKEIRVLAGTPAPAGSSGWRPRQPLNLMNCPLSLSNAGGDLGQTPL